jgi:NADPH-dependent glutamate synthase beta subunit-like oxidoreductase/NAD(P)H-flavin reductase
VTRAGSRRFELGVAGFGHQDLFAPEKLRELHEVFLNDFGRAAPEARARFDAYRAVQGGGYASEQVSAVLLEVAPYVSQFVAKLFCVEPETEALKRSAEARSPLWKFKREFVKKRVHKHSASAEALPAEDALALATAFTAEHRIHAGASRNDDEEFATASVVLALWELDDTARKVASAGGALWTDKHQSMAIAVRNSAQELRGARIPDTFLTDQSAPGALSAFLLSAYETALWSRLQTPGDAARTWQSLKAPKNLDYAHLVHLKRPNERLQELFVGTDDARREREGFALTDARGDARLVEQEIDYCLFCHERDKDSCSKGLKEAKTGTLKKNPLGVLLAGCPLDEKISEMHTMRRSGDALAALLLVTLDNPMCAGTGHRICNDCMKACVFQKQEPVNIPQIETRVLTEVLELPFGLEIYGFLTRWNPLNVKRPYALPYNGKNVLVVGLGPAGYTLAHHLVREGFGVVAIDGLKVEPLPQAWLSQPIERYESIQSPLDERVVFGFGGVSEYGITVRWDKNFLTLLYITLARNPLLKIYGGVRFGGTLTLEDAWSLGMDHVALAAGAGRPTIIDMKNNLARGIRQASDFLMGLQLSGAYKKNGIANLQVSLPAIVIGGGLTAIDTSTELLAYYPVQIERSLLRFETLVQERGEQAVRTSFDAEEWRELSRQLEHARELREERALAIRENREARVQALVTAWGGVTLVYRKSLADSPAYRLNHEEVEKSLEEGVRYFENLSPTEALLDETGHVRGVLFKRADGSTVELSARTVCVAAGTSPNITYEREYEGSFALDAKGQYFKTHSARVAPDGAATLEEGPGFFASYQHRSASDNSSKLVSFYGDNHPVYAGSVVKAMASAKHGYEHVAALFPEIKNLQPAEQAERYARLNALFEMLDSELLATVHAVNRLTPTIVEVVVKAPLAARKFEPGQFYRLQNYESLAPSVDGTSLTMEGLALTGAWIDKDQGLMGTIVLEMGGSSRLCAALVPGERVVLMGPTGAPTHIAAKETVLLCGGGLGNAVLFSIARAFKAMGSRVLYFAGYKQGEDMYKRGEIEAHTDQVIWTTDAGIEIAPGRPQDVHFRGNIVQALVAYGKRELGREAIPLREVNRIIAIGSDRMMAAVKEARHGVLATMLNPKHLAIGSINSPMQCMMKEICAQCLQKHIDPVTKKESVVFSCYNQDQELDHVDFAHLAQRLRANSMQEKLMALWLDRTLRNHPSVLKV